MLPATLIICVRTSVKDKFEVQSLDILGPVIATGLVLYSLFLLGTFQSQERVWQRTLDRAKALAIINLGLSPFVFWHLRLPMVAAYATMMLLFSFTCLVFLLVLNQVLLRLTAMLPDEALREETVIFATFNQYVLVLVPMLSSTVLVLSQISGLPPEIARLLQYAQHLHQWFFIFFTLLPVAMTMALVWKIKAAILTSIFGGGD
jgi:hypothetical protein